MFLAFGDSPRDPDHRPRVTQVLILTNVLVYLGLVAWVVYAFVNGWDVEAAQAVAQLGFFSMQPTLLQSVSYAFLHAGLVHLAGNMLYLWVYGPNLERRLNPVGFLALYIGAAVMGAAVHALWSIHDGPMVGASGAVSGVLGAYLMFFSGQPHPLHLSTATDSSVESAGLVGGDRVLHHQSTGGVSPLLQRGL
jgi:membrane associated rhomboid family serine protease